MRGVGVFSSAHFPRFRLKCAGGRVLITDFRIMQLKDGNASGKLIATAKIDVRAVRQRKEL